MAGTYSLLAEVIGEGPRRPAEPSPIPDLPAMLTAAPGPALLATAGSAGTPGAALSAAAAGAALSAAVAARARPPLRIRRHDAEEGPAYWRGGRARRGGD